MSEIDSLRAAVRQMSPPDPIPPADEVFPTVHLRSCAAAADPRAGSTPKARAWPRSAVTQAASFPGRSVLSRPAPRVLRVLVDSFARHCVTKEELVHLEGEVILIAKGGNFRVKLENGHEVLAKLAGKVRRHRIRVVLGDRVTVAVSVYDPSRGFIVYRQR